MRSNSRVTLTGSLRTNRRNSANQRISGDLSAKRYRQGTFGRIDRANSETKVGNSVNYSAEQLKLVVRPYYGADGSLQHP